MDIKASIIIITYNQSESIGRAIESVLAQECGFRYEIVIGNDGSSDGTRQVCERYASLYPDKIRLMPEAPNKGIVDNYFDCLASCCGEYITDCAGDDTWGDASRLQKQVDYLDTHPGDMAVISDWEIDNGMEIRNTRNMSEYSKFRKNMSGRFIMHAVLSTMGIFPLLSAMLYRREPVTEILSKDSARLCRKEWGCEDVPLIAAIGSLGDVGYVPVTAYRYSIVAGGISTARNFGKLFDFYSKACGCVLDLCDIYGVRQDEVTEALRGRLRYLGDLALRAYNPERVRQYKALCRRIPARGIKPRIYALLLGSGAGRNILRTIKRVDL